jgi:hypothetical protein
MPSAVTRSAQLRQQSSVVGPLSPTTSNSITPSDSVSAVDSDHSTAVRSSWVWTYFITKPDNEGVMKNFCQAKEGFIDSVSASDTDPTTSVPLCNEPMAIDKNSSTKSMSRHLSRAHHITRPIETEQPVLPAFYINGSSNPVSDFISLFLFFLYLFYSFLLLNVFSPFFFSFLYSFFFYLFLSFLLLGF